MTSGGKIFKYFPEYQLTSAGDSIELSITLSFIKISLVGTAEMREILVTRRVCGRWL